MLLLNLLTACLIDRLIAHSATEINISGQCVAIARSSGRRYSCDHHWSVSERGQCCLLWSAWRCYWQPSVSISPVRITYYDHSV